MWSDPEEIENWAVSPRGAGWLFGGNVTQEVRLSFIYSWYLVLISFDPASLSIQFNHVNQLSLIARAHQLVQEGFKFMFDDQLVTVWSAPNYCYRCGNMASILTITESGERAFTVFGAAEENERDQEMLNGRKLVSAFVSTRLRVL